MMKSTVVNYKAPSRWLYLWLLLLFSNALQAQFYSDFPHNGITRRFIAYFPFSYQPGQHLPLVFVMHGYTQDANITMGFSGFNQIAETNNFIAVYPDGVGNAWNIQAAVPGASTADDIGFINALLDSMIQWYQIDPARVYACGFSAGGYMSHQLACASSERFAAIASVAGTMTSTAYSNCNPSRPVPVMQIHGTNDLIVPYNGLLGNLSVNDVINFWKNNNDCPGTATVTSLPDVINEGSNVEQSLWSPCGENTEIQLLKVNNGGHTWPGAPFSGIGNTNRDIDASQVIWDFFERFSLNISSSQEAPVPLSWEIMPNPAHSGQSVRVKVAEAEAWAYLRLSDATGRIYYREEHIAGEECFIPLPQGQTGCFFLEGSCAGRRIVQCIIILE